MRKIEEQMNEAIIGRFNFTSGNTSVTIHPNSSAEVRLHGNLIALIEYNDAPIRSTVRLYDGGWQTSTTKSRLAAIAQGLGVEAPYQRNFEWFMDYPQERSEFVDGITQYCGL